MNVIKLALGICCALFNAGLYGLTIVNNSDSPKQVELVAYVPSLHHAGGFDALTVVKQELQPLKSVHSPLSLREVGVAMSWGGEKLSNPETKTTWRTIEKSTPAAQEWQSVGSALCGERQMYCEIVIPPTWRIEENAQGVTLSTDANTTLKAANRAELLTHIPYRRIVNTFMDKRVLASTQPLVAQWKKFGNTNTSGEEIVIPHSWTMDVKEESIILTTDEKKEIAIPYVRETFTDPATQKTSERLLANEKISLSTIPYRRKNGLVFETIPTDKAVIVEEALEKPLKTSRFNLFRRFSPQDALPAPHARGVPERVGQDHVFEITGSGYDADVTLAYAPTAPTLGKRKREQENEHENSINQQIRAMAVKK